MIFGIGTDIFSISRMRPLAGLSNDPFFCKAFTKEERMQAIKRADPVVYYSTHFAGKEAVYKAISLSGCDFVPEEIEIIDSADGRPEVIFYGNTLNAMKKYSSINVLLSLSWDGDYACASALVEVSERGK